MLINVHRTSTSARYFQKFQNDFLTGTIHYLSIPSKNFNHKCKKTIKSTSTFGPSCIVHFKYTKNVCTFWKSPFQNQPKSVRLQATYGNLHYLRKWFRQCNLSSLKLTPHTIANLLIMYLHSTYPKIANLIQILYIVCRALGCIKGGSCERFAIDVIQISTTRRTGFNWCEAEG